MVIEIKQASPPMGRELCETIRRHRMQNRVIVPSFSDDAIRAFRAACPEVATAAGRGEVTTFLPLAMLRLDGTLTPAYHALQVPQVSGGIPVTTPAFVEAARRRNLQVHVWTINDPAEMRALIDLGVHGIMTDRPDVLLRLLGRAP
jgi:glycerophosphoryl diester phosphodiesterase